MSRKIRAPFAYNKVFVAMCLVAMPAAPTFAVITADGSTTLTQVPDNGTDNYMSATNGGTIEVTGSRLLFTSTDDGIAIASATGGGKLLFTKGPNLQGSGNAADTISLNNGTLEALDAATQIIATGEDSWGINAQNGSTVNFAGGLVSGAGAGSILLGNNSTLTASDAAISSTSTAIAIQLKADSGSEASATLTAGSLITSQNNDAVNITNGNVIVTDARITSSGANAINAVSGANIDVTSTTANTSIITAQGNNASAVLLGSDTSLTSANSKFIASGANGKVINTQGGTAVLSGDLINAVGVGSHGLSSSAGSITGSNGLTIDVGGESGVGAYATTTGNVDLTDTTVTTTKDNATGLFAATEGTVNAAATTVRTEGNNSAAVKADAGKVTLNSATSLTTIGTGSAGILSANGGNVDAIDTNVGTTGTDAYALSVNQGSINVTNGTLTTGAAAGIFATGNNASAAAGSVKLDTVTVDAAQSSVLSQGGMLDVTATGTTFNSGTGLVLDVQADTAGANSNVNFNADSSVLNGSLVSDSTQNVSNVTLNNASTLTGYSKNVSSISLLDVDSKWNLTANSDVQSLTNNGTITFSTPTSGDYKTLTVNGNYAGNGGTLVMNSLLSDDNSPTDKLIVTGNVEAGDTKVAINELGGTGAYTVNGIEVVSVGGVSEGTFTKSGRIVAGAYDYNLEKINESWYLTNKAPDVTDPGVTDPGVTDPGVTDPGVTDPGVTEPGVTPPGVTDPEPGPGLGESQYRPETGSYLANMLAANTMFDHRMQDRLGEGSYARSADGAHADGLWMRHVGGHNRFYDESGQLKARTNRYVLQLGYDLAQWSSDGYDRWHVGVMGGYGNAQSNIRSELTGYRADSKVEGYSAGVYATWVESEKDMSGAYVDSWVLYNWFHNTINGQELATEKYDSKGFTASLEAGYTVPMTQGERVSSWLQPKVQLTWMDVGADNHREHNGTWVTDDTDGMLRSRVGVRAYLKGHSELDNNTGRDFQPFVEANWLHNFGDYSVKMDDVTNSIAGDKNVGELKLGVEGKIANDFTMWGNVAQQVGSAGYSDTSVMFGARLNF